MRIVSFVSEILVSKGQLYTATVHFYRFRQINTSTLVIEPSTFLITTIPLTTDESSKLPPNIFATLTYSLLKFSGLEGRIEIQA